MAAYSLDLRTLVLIAICLELRAHEIRTSRWDDDHRIPRPRRRRPCHRRVSGDAHKRILDRGEQIEGADRIIARHLGQCQGSVSRHGKCHHRRSYCPRIQPTWRRP